MQIIDYLYKGTVELNLDPEMKGRIKVRVENLFGDTSVALLPWAYPIINSVGGSDDYGSSLIPEKGAEVWVLILNTDLLDPLFYLAGFNFEDTSSFHNKFTTEIKAQLSANTITSSSIYPDMKFTTLKNGLAFGYSSGDRSKEAFIFHPDGTIIYIENSGNIQVRTSSADIKVKSTSGNIELEATSGKIKTKGVWEHTGDISVLEGKLDVDLEVTAMNTSPATKVSLSNHLTSTSVPGPPGPPVPGT